MDPYGKLHPLGCGGTVFLYSGNSSGSMSALAGKNEGLMATSCLKNPPPVPPVGQTRDDQIRELGVQNSMLDTSAKWKKRFVLFRATCSGWIMTIYRPVKDAMRHVNVNQVLANADAAAAAGNASPGRQMNPDNKIFTELIAKGLCEVKAEVSLGNNAVCWRSFSRNQLEDKFRVTKVDSFTGKSSREFSDFIVHVKLPGLGNIEFVGRDDAHLDSWWTRIKAIMDSNQKVLSAAKLAREVPANNLMPNAFKITTDIPSGQPGVFCEYACSLVSRRLLCEFVFEFDGKLIPIKKPTGSPTADPNAPASPTVPSPPQFKRWRLIIDGSGANADDAGNVEVSVVDLGSPPPGAEVIPADLDPANMEMMKLWSRRRGSSLKAAEDGEIIRVKIAPYGRSIPLGAEDPRASQEWRAGFRTRWADWINGLTVSAESEDNALATQVSFSYNKHQEMFASPGSAVFEQDRNASSTSQLIPDVTPIPMADSIDDSTSVGQFTPQRSTAPDEPPPGTPGSPRNSFRLPAATEAVLSDMEAFSRLQITDLEEMGRGAMGEKCPPPPTPAPTATAPATMNGTAPANEGAASPPRSAVNGTAAPQATHSTGAPRKGVDSAEAAAINAMLKKLDAGDANGAIGEVVRFRLTAPMF